MNAHINNVQIIKKDGLPIFAVIPYENFLFFYHQDTGENTIPQEVAEKAMLNDIPLIKAWRLYMGLTQKNVDQKARITQAALSQMQRTENRKKTATLEKLAAALNVSVEQLTD